jgi:hypothetical protein
MSNGKRSRGDHQKKQAGARYDEQHETDDAKCKSPDLTPLNNKIQALVETYKTTHKDDKQKSDDSLYWNRLATVFTGLGFLAAAIYAFISYSQWQDLRRNFEVEQRSLLKITPSFLDNITEGMKIQIIPVNISNVGKSVALEVAVQGASEVVKNSDTPSLLVDRRHTLVGISLFYPNDTDRLQIGFRGFLAEQLTPAQVADLLDGKSYIAVYGQAEYRDQFGLHWERFCTWKSYSHEFVKINNLSCYNFNAIGDGEPPSQ